VDVSTGNRATLGGMAGNNSCGSRSIRYGNMVHNVRTIDALLADGSEHRFCRGRRDLSGLDADARYAQIVRRLRALGEREPVRSRGVSRSCCGASAAITSIRSSPAATTWRNCWSVSEGTLAFFTRLELKLQPIPPHKVLGICHFPSFYQAMDATQHVVKLDPSAVELVDRTMIDLSRDIAMFAPPSSAVCAASRTRCCWSSSPARITTRSWRSCAGSMSSWANSDFRMRWWKRSIQSSRARVWEVRQGRAPIS